MKQLLITILIIILLIFGWTQYQNYTRFNSPGLNYVASNKIDKNYHDQLVLQNYYQAIEDVNGYVRLEWATQKIDVRNPEDDDADTFFATKQYTKKLALVKQIEDRLIQSSKLKATGLTNNDVIAFEQSGSNYKTQNDFIKVIFLKKTFDSNPEKYSLKIGDCNVFVFEIQKILVKKGYPMPVDGFFRDFTQKGILNFEQKNGLFADGKLDDITLDYLLR